MPFQESEKLAVLLIEALDGHCGFGSRLQHMGAHLRHLPSRLGRNVALDASVSCMLQYYMFAARGQPQNRALELTRYCTAIQALRGDLASTDHTGVHSVSSETISAALILARYELFRPSSMFSCVTIAGGVSAIFKGLGPTRVVSDFELAIFTTHYPTIISQALLLGQECFLSDPAWTNVMRRGAGTPGKLTTELWISLTKLPELSRRAKALESLPADSVTNSATYASVLVESLRPPEKHCRPL